MKALELIDKADERIRTLWIMLYSFSYGFAWAIAQREHKCMVFRFRAHRESLQPARSACEGSSMQCAALKPKAGSSELPVDFYWPIDPKEWVLGTYLLIALALYVMLTCQYRLRHRLIDVAHFKDVKERSSILVLAAPKYSTWRRMAFVAWIVVAALLPIASAGYGIIEICKGFSPWFGESPEWLGVLVSVSGAAFVVATTRWLNAIWPLSTIDRWVIHGMRRRIGVFTRHKEASP
jgi:hypothetical protein